MLPLRLFLFISLSLFLVSFALFARFLLNATTKVPKGLFQLVL